MLALQSEDIKALGRAANIAIRRSLADGAPNFTNRPTTEVGFINAVVTGAIPSIGAQWRQILAPLHIRLSMTGVFCHSSPMVNFLDSKCTRHRCELADLLIVHDHLPSGSLAGSSRSAVLIQAKTTPTGMVRSPDAAQFELYANWPTFQISHSQFDTRSRNFSALNTPGAASDCGQYGIIKTKPSTSPLWRITQPIKPLQSTNGVELGTFMSEMLDAASSSRGRPAVVNGKDDWSFTIDELLRITAQRMFAHRATLGPSVRKRAGATIVSFTPHANFITPGDLPWLDLTAVINGAGDGEPPSVDRPIDDDGIGSTIYIRTISTRD